MRRRRERRAPLIFNDLNTPGSAKRERKCPISGRTMVREGAMRGLCNRIPPLPLLFLAVAVADDADPVYARSKPAEKESRCTSDP